MARLTLPAAAALSLAALAACADVNEPAAAGDLGAPARLAASSAAEQVMPGEVLVKVRAGAEVAEVARGHGAALAEHGYRNAFAVVRGAAGNERALAAALRRDARVEWAEPNYLRQKHAIDSRLWAFFNPGGLNMLYSQGKNSGKPLGSSYASTNDADIDNIEAYAVGGAAVVVGSIDTGVDMDHPEFAGRLIAGKDWYNNDNDPEDDDGHGTHTSGTMAGLTVGVAGVSGAAANVKVHVQKVCGRRGCPVSAISNAIMAAADVPGMVAVNVSIGGTSLSSSEQSAIDYAKARDVLVFASSGNSNTGTVECPACDPDAISVGATNWRDERAAYSNWGPGLDLVAPGGYCYSNTTPDACIYSAYLNGGYDWLLGTSMATPQATGTAAIVASKTGLRGASLRARIEGTTDDLGANGYDTTFGNGRVNSYRAVTNGSLAAGL